MSFDYGHPFLPRVALDGMAAPTEEWTARQARVRELEAIVRRTAERSRRAGREMTADHLIAWLEGRTPPPLGAQYVRTRPETAEAIARVRARFLSNLAGDLPDSRFGYPALLPELDSPKRRAGLGTRLRPHLILEHRDEDPWRDKRWWWAAASPHPWLGGVTSDFAGAIGGHTIVGSGAVELEETHPGMFRVRGPVDFGLRDNYDWTKGPVWQTLVGGRVLSLDDMRFLEEHGTARPFPIRSELWTEWIDGNFVGEGNRLLPVGEVYFGAPPLKSVPRRPW